MSVSFLSQSAFPVASGITPAIQTSSGNYHGIVVDNVDAFLGIRYGASPAGEKRFLPPQKPEQNTRAIIAGTYGHSAMQLSPTNEEMSYPMSVAMAVGQLLNSEEDLRRQNEDCLFLNIWANSIKTDEKKPVLVMLHGGAISYGSGAAISCNGYYVASRQDIVVVAINHRLNAFGFLNLAASGDERFKHSGNVGMLDIVLALEWVKDNIEHFGGDAGNVTICGQSGGGQKASALMAMPSAQGLFHKAIIQSGPGPKVGTAEKSQEITEDICSVLKVDVTDIDALQALPAEKIIEAAYSFPVAKRLSHWRPTLDDFILPSHPFEPKANPLCIDIPLLIGFNKDESTSFFIGEPWYQVIRESDLPGMFEPHFKDKVTNVISAAKKLFPHYAAPHIYSALLTFPHYFMDTIRIAERKSKQAAPVYSYVFNYETVVDNGILRACHCAEAPFAFDMLEHTPILSGNAPEALTLAKNMGNAWANFMRTGNPNHSGLPKWETYNSSTRATMAFDKECKVVNDLYGDVRQLLNAK